MAAQVMIELVPDASKVKGAIDQLEQTGGDVSAFKDGNAELQKRNQLLAQGLSTSEKIEAQEKKQIATLGGLAKATGSVATEVIKISGSEFAKAMQDQGKSAQQLINSLAGVTTEAKKETQATTSLRGEKKKLTEEIGRLIASGQQESQMFRDLVARAGEIDDAMSDATDAIRRTGSDTKGLDNALLVARGVAAGFTVMTGAAAIFGNESEEVQKVLLKVNAAMAILNGLQEIQNLLKSEYVKSLLASITATKTQTTALTAEAAATEGATAAQVGLNTAMMANPVLLIIGLLGAVATAMLLFADNTEEAKKSQEGLSEALANSIVTLNDYNQKLDKSLEIEKALAEQRGASGSEMISIEVDALQKKIDKTKEAADQAKALMNDESKTAQERFAANQQYYELILTTIPKLEQEARVKEIQGTTALNTERKRVTEEQKKATESAIRDAEKLNEKYKELNNTIKAFFNTIRGDGSEAAKVIAEFQKDVDTALNQPIFDIFDENVKAQQEEKADSLLEILNRHLAARTASVDKQAEEEKTIREKIAEAAIQNAAAIANTIFEINTAQRQAETDAQLAELEKQKDAALNTENLTKAQQKEIEKRYNRDVARIKTEAARKQRDADANAAYVNTLLAITNALATTKPFVPAALIAAATAFTTGMLQVARINSAPLPQYAKGGRNVPSGMALVGEQGPELIDLKGGEDIYTARDSARMMHEWVMPDHSTSINKGAKSQGIDYDKLADAITKKMPRQPNVSLNADEHGFSIFVESENHRKTIRNQRYSTR